jgi:predicted transposase YdaD
MRESVIYQELREEVSELEREKGRAEGRAEEGRSLVLRQLARRVGTLPAAVQSQVEALPLTQLETLGEDLLDFTSLIDLENWLAQ